MTVFERTVQASAAAGLLLLGLSLAGCRPEKLTEALCRFDADCDPGNLCENSACIPASTLKCTVVTQGDPILQPDPHSVNFPSIDLTEVSQELSLNNIGNCALTVFEATLTGTPGSPFVCDGCESLTFPLEIFPNREQKLKLSFKPEKVGRYADTLTLLSDDKEFRDLKVPIHGEFVGMSKVVVAPDPVEFGYLAKGLASSKHVQVTNQGTGTAIATVQSVTLDPSTDHFTLSTSATLPLVLAPSGTENPAILGLDVQFHPRTEASHHTTLVVVTDKGQQRIAVTGNSQTPPKLTVNPTSIDLGKVPLGHTNSLPLTLVNEGGAPLTVWYVWGGSKPSTDLFATPQQVPTILPGAYLDMQVAFTATALGPVNGLIVLTANDPARPSLTVPVTGEGIQGPGPDVVKIDMYYENGSETAFDADLRNVQLTLEHPYGYVCNKQNPAPTNWGAFGNPTWISFGIKEKPQRVVLADANKDGTYRVMVQYSEDCGSLPTALLAGMLGISIDVLQAILLSGVPGPINGQDIGKLIENVCLQHQPTDVTARAYVNGTLIKESSVKLLRKGDSQYMIDLVRANGTFTAK